MKKNVFYKTNWGIISVLKKSGMRIFDNRKDKLINPELIERKKIKQAVYLLKRLGLSWLVFFLLKASFYNPFKRSVVLYAQKKDR